MYKSLHAWVTWTIKVTYYSPSEQKKVKLSYSWRYQFSSLLRSYSTFNWKWCHILHTSKISTSTSSSTKTIFKQPYWPCASDCVLGSRKSCDLKPPEENISRARKELSPKFLYCSFLMEKRYLYLAMWMWLLWGQVKSENSSLPVTVLEILSKQAAFSFAPLCSLFSIFWSRRSFQIRYAVRF